jgi:hypothetical protein
MDFTFGSLLPPCLADLANSAMSSADNLLDSNCFFNTSARGTSVEEEAKEAVPADEEETPADAEETVSWRRLLFADQNFDTDNDLESLGEAFAKDIDSHSKTAAIRGRAAMCILILKYIKRLKWRERNVRVMLRVHGFDSIFATTSCGSNLVVGNPRPNCEQMSRNRSRTPRRVVSPGMLLTDVEDYGADRFVFREEQQLPIVPVLDESANVALKDDQESDLADLAKFLDDGDVQILQEDSEPDCANGKWSFHFKRWWIEHKDSWVTQQYFWDDEINDWNGYVWMSWDDWWAAKFW